MIPIHTIFGAFLVFFALIGSLRGWAKEIIVAFSVILALFVEHVLLSFLPPVRALFDNMTTQSQFFVRSSMFIFITIFGYASPTLATRFGAKIARDRLEDLLLGFFLGMFNGFLIVGTLLSFLHAANYGILDDPAVGIGGIVPPAPDSTSENLMDFMPPALIAKSDAALYIAVAASFVFVIIVFI
ncbi:MAG TPA: hypothetical protein ENN19_02000 [Chloroflexi bacterium]|nr:hypothetical protein [Chloroflexota bacterium]